MNPSDFGHIIYTPSPFARANLIHLQEIGHLKTGQGHTSHGGNPASCLFFVVEEGSGTLLYNGAETPVKSGDCVFIDCRRPYSHRACGASWTLKWLHFYGPNMAAIYEKYVQRGGKPCFAPQDLSAYIRLLDGLMELADSQIYIRDMKIFEKLASLLSLLMEDSFDPKGALQASSLKRDLQEVKDYLDLHYGERITLDSLAGTFFINKFYLTRVFREQFGMTINDYLLQVRVTHAKQLLRFTDLPVEKIALSCGIADSNYFSRVFRKVEGLSPIAFRKGW